ncbi:MAG: exo-alpha-sialidase [Gemmatimonadetes bacterium]|nr:exo-alpha-sialidase [Gemmatimonadota bacterium]
MPRSLRRFAWVLAAGCAGRGEPAPPAGFTAMASPSGARAAEPYLAVDPQGVLHMTWIERTGDSTAAVKYARLRDSTWSPPTTIVERKDLFVNWADFPAVAIAPSGGLVVHWLQRSGAGTYAYDIRVARSADAGQSWTAPQVLHRDGRQAEHGFLTFWPGGGDTVHAAWLDGRHMEAGDGHGRGAMTVQSTSIAGDGSLGAELALDMRNCECCQVNSALTARGPVVVYRDRSEDEVRDIAIVRQVNGTWTPPAKVHDDGWQIAACPVNGPAITARGDTVVVAWFTGARDTARVKVAWSVDAGATFGAPAVVDGGNPAGRVDVELLPDGSAAVSWLERVPPEAAEVRVRRARRDGTLGAPMTVATTSGARASGFPKLVQRGDDFVAAWTVPGDTARILLGRMPAKGLP